MKLGLFSDAHYCDDYAKGNRMCSLSYQKICEAFEDFKKHNVDMVMCLGDLFDASSSGTEQNIKSYEKIMSIIENSGLPFILVPGNHDFLSAGCDVWEKRLGKLMPPFVYDTSEYRFICLDANFEKDMSHYSPDGFDWIDTNLPQEQLDFLEKSIAESTKECIVAVHEPIDSQTEEVFRVNNAEDVRKIIEKSGKVKLVIQGHMHEYYDVYENGVRYITVTGICKDVQNRYMLLEMNENLLSISVINKTLK